jgi:hypothetical protein
MPLGEHYFCHANMPIVRIARLETRLAVCLLSPDLTHMVLARDKDKPMSSDPSQLPPTANVAERKPLTPAAQRALAEAEARRQAAAVEAKAMPKEYQGPTGPEPTRYGDWERKGIASDF